jgi:hypothetical protein
MSPSPAEVAAHIPKLQVISCLLRRRFHARNILPLRLRKRAGKPRHPLVQRIPWRLFRACKGSPRRVRTRCPGFWLTGWPHGLEYPIQNVDCRAGQWSLAALWATGGVVVAVWFPFGEVSIWSQCAQCNNEAIACVTAHGSDWPCYFRIPSPVRREYYD